MLRQVVGEVRELLDPPDDPPPAGDAGSLEDLLDRTQDPIEPPVDPALARLLPDAYRDDAAAAAEWRRLTEPELRATKQAAADRLLGDLADDGGKLVLDDESAEAWLGALNDVRLVLGTRLDVTEDGDPLGGYAADEPMAQPYLIYHWLTALQDALVHAVSDD